MRRHPRLAMLAATVLAAPFLIAIATPAAAVPPVVLAFTPLSGAPGTSVTITGAGFDDLSPATDVDFNGTAALFAVDSDTQITATVPIGATTGPISVTDAEGGSSSAIDFTVTPAPPPTVDAFVPISGPEGTSVTIAGSDFTGATGVEFNGTAATYTVDSDAQVTATVPVGATTGPISVTTPSGTGTSAIDFTVTPPGSPVVLSFVPTAGPVGIDVTITGSAFTGATDVDFNGTAAPFTVDSDTQITATVPAGATTGPISVTTPAGSASSATDFTVTDSPQVHDRTVSLRTRGELVLRGRIRLPDGFDACRVGVRVVGRYQRDGTWRSVGSATTTPRGTYEIETPGRTGTYRVTAPRVELNSGLDICARAQSKRLRWPG